jgi:hypothetical protein
MIQFIKVAGDIIRLKTVDRKNLPIYYESGDIAYNNWRSVLCLQIIIS